MPAIFSFRQGATPAQQNGRCRRVSAWCRIVSSASPPVSPVAGISARRPVVRLASHPGGAPYWTCCQFSLPLCCGHRPGDHRNLKCPARARPPVASAHRPALSPAACRPNIHKTHPSRRMFNKFCPASGPFPPAGTSCMVVDAPRLPGGRPPVASRKAAHCRCDLYRTKVLIRAKL